MQYLDSLESGRGGAGQHSFIFCEIKLLPNKPCGRSNVTVYLSGFSSVDNTWTRAWTDYRAYCLTPLHKDLNQ